MLFDFHLGGYASLYLNASFNTFNTSTQVFITKLF